MTLKTKKVANTLNTLIEKHLITILDKERQVIIDIIMDDYDLMLNGVDTNLNSQSKPEFYEEKFRDLLEDLDDDFWIDISKEGKTEIYFRIPTVTNLDLKELPVLKLIFEGIAGKYVTATAGQFKLAKVKIGSRVPLDEKVRSSDRVYLIRAADPIRRRLESTLNKLCLNF